MTTISSRSRSTRRRGQPRRRQCVDTTLAEALFAALFCSMLFYAVVYRNATDDDDADTSSATVRSSPKDTVGLVTKEEFLTQSKNRPQQRRMGGATKLEVTAVENKEPAGATEQTAATGKVADVAAANNDRSSLIETSANNIVDKATKNLDARGDRPRHVCLNYHGLLHIASGDQGAAAGTLFFQYIVNQLLYAEMYNLMPFVYLNDITANVYDEDLHSQGQLELTVRGKLTIPWETDDHPRPPATPDNLTVTEWAWPGHPYMPTHKAAHRKRNIMLAGDGVWNHYFEPVSDYDPNHHSCQRLPYVTLDYTQLNPGIQFFWPTSVRSWEYSFLPYFLLSNHTPGGTLHDWFDPQRRRANKIINRYYRFQPNIRRAVSALIPDDTQCLAVHIRHSDKAGKARHKIPEDAFLPYLKSYVANGGGKIYLATDSSRVLDYVQRFWPVLNNNTIISQGDVVRSAVRKPVFRQGNHNRTNTEVLVDILALSRCQFMVHGFSAVSESAHYLNLDLHNRSVDLEDDRHMTADEFGKLVGAYYKGWAYYNES